MRRDRDRRTSLPYPEPRPFVPAPVSPAILPGSLRARMVASLEDRRQFYPGPRPPASVDRRSRRMVVAAPKAKNLTGRMDQWLSHRLAFALPENVAICAKRKIRREVLMALKPFRRKGGGGGSKRRRNEFSDVRC